MPGSSAETRFRHPFIKRPLFPAHEHTCDLRRMVVEEKARVRVESGDFLHIIGREVEIEDVEVLLHSFHMRGLRDYYDSTLDEPAERHLGDAFAVLPSNLRKNFVSKEIVASLGKRSPCHHARTELFHNLLSLNLLVEHMRLHLVDGRDYLHVAGKVDEMVRIEVGHADCANLALG